MIRILRSIDLLIDKLCVIGLALALFFMISLTILNIILTQFNLTLFWIEPMVRQLVFYTAFLGGAVATAAKQHIAIDMVSRALESLQLLHLKKWIDRLIYLFCIATLLWMAYAGYLFVDEERIYGSVQFLGIHSAVLASVVPIGLFVIAYRFFFLLVQSFDSQSEDDSSQSSASLASREGI